MILLCYSKTYAGGFNLNHHHIKWIHWNKLISLKYRELEEENASLQAEYEHLQLHQNNMSMNEDSNMKDQSGGQDIITEAKLLRQHKVIFIV